MVDIKVTKSYFVFEKNLNRTLFIKKVRTETKKEKNNGTCFTANFLKSPPAAVTERQKSTFWR